MRDMHIKKFERCCIFMGFSPIPDQLVFKSDDGRLQVKAVLVSGSWNNTGRIDRRATLEKLSVARREADATPGVGFAQEKATGALTPMAS